MDLDYSGYDISIVHNNQPSARLSNEEVIDDCGHREDPGGESDCTLGCIQSA